MRKRAPLLFPTSLLVAASLESAHAWTVQNDRDVPCTVSHLAACGSSGFQGSIMRLAPVPVAYHLCPLQALDAMALLSHTPCFDTASLSSYEQLLLFSFSVSPYFFFILFLPRLLFGSRWPPTLGQRHCPWHRPCQDTMRAHGHAGKCTINMVA